MGNRREGEGEVEGRERDGPQVTVEPGPLRALLRHCRLINRGSGKNIDRYLRGRTYLVDDVSLFTFL